MCGLAGVASTERRKGDEVRRSAFRQMLQVASWRGEDATGVAYVRIAAPKEAPVVYKRAIPAWDFTHLEHYKRLGSRFDEYGFCIGHARSSTSDGWNLSDNNAHPFQVENITLVHNGTIRNYRTLDSGIDHPVDSAHVAAALVEQEPGKLLEKLSGPFALVWHDALDGSLNFAKNHERPLFWCYVKGQNTMYWGSELEAIYAVLARHEIEIDGKFRHCSSYTHFKFKMEDLRGFSRTPFGRRPSLPALPPTTHHGQHCAPWKEGMRRLPSTGTDCAAFRESGTTHLPGSASQETTNLTSSGLKTDTGLTGDDDDPIIITKKDSLRPRSRKKLRLAKERLLSLGRKLDAPICFVPEYFVPYKNQRDARGCVQGHDRSKNQKFEIGHVQRDVWQKCLEHGRIYGRIVNVKRDHTIKGGFIVVCDYDVELMERFVFKPHAKPTTPEVVDAKAPFSELVSDTAGSVTGPGDRRIPVIEFMELVKHGCGYCSRDLSPEDHETILWVGPQQHTPICSVCSVSSEVKLQLGIQDEAKTRP